MGHIQARFGTASLHAAASRPEVGETVEAWPTGLAEIDRLTSVGGFPAGRMSLCLGGTGTGKLLVGYHFLAHTSQAAATVLFLDLRRHADPWLLARLGTRLDRVIVVRPPLQGEDGLRVSLESALALVRAGVGGVVADLPPGAGGSGLWDPYAALLTAACAKAAVPLLVVAEAAAEPLRYAASIVVRLNRREWLLSHGDIAGVRLEAAVEKNKLGPPGVRADLDLAYPTGRFMAPAPVAEAEAVASELLVMEAVGGA